jgi:hypothetical protein
MPSQIPPFLVCAAAAVISLLHNLRQSSVLKTQFCSNALNVRFIADLLQWLGFCAHVHEFYSFLHIPVAPSGAKGTRATLRFTSVS